MGLAADERVAGSCSTSGRELSTSEPVLVLQERLRKLPFIVKVSRPVALGLNMMATEI